ncbi:MAG: hypothetical protein Q4E20_01445 [Eubacteriales bacterium]|nr:hypothetical protein [Eubacteriales bacterium]
MKHKSICKRCIVGIIAAFIVCVASATIMCLYPAFSSAMGIVAILAMAVFSLCCSRLVSTAFKAETGSSLSDYFQKLYGGYWRKANQNMCQEEQKR